MKDGPDARIVVRLPTLEEDAASAASSSNPQQRKILVVDDCDDAAAALRALLGLFGHDVAVARDGTEGLAAALHWQPDIIFSNVGLHGGMDGYALAAALRASSDEIRNVYLIAMSDDTHDEDQQRAVPAGYDLHLAKPIVAKLLHGVLNDIAVMSETKRNTR